MTNEEYVAKYKAAAERNMTRDMQLARLPDRIRNIGPVIGAIRHSGPDYVFSVACVRPGFPASRAYGTQTVVWRDTQGGDLGHWTCVGNGHYDLSRDDALKDMMAR